MKKHLAYSAVLALLMISSGAQAQPASWKRISPVNFTERMGLACCVVGGKIYAIGGYNASKGGLFNIIERYDPLTDFWEEIPAQGDLPPPHFNATATFAGGKIYLIGSQPFRDTVWVFDTLNFT